MAVAIIRRGREPFAAGDLIGGSSKEKRAPPRGTSLTAVVTSMRATPCGITSRSACSPIGAASTRTRLVEVAGDRLTLSTRPMLFQGIQQSAHLVWERV
jgi:hypothetical protein